MLIDCGLTKKDLKDSRLFCHDGDSETNEEWYERLKQFGFGAGLDDGEEKVHLYYFRWRRKAIYAQRKGVKPSRTSQRTTGSAVVEFIRFMQNRTMSWGVARGQRPIPPPISARAELLR